MLFSKLKIKKRKSELILEEMNLFFSVLLFIVFIPGTLFTLPKSEEYNDGFWSKAKVNFVHGCLFLVVLFLFNHLVCNDTVLKNVSK